MDHKLGLNCNLVYLIVFIISALFSFLFKGLYSFAQLIKFSYGLPFHDAIADIKILSSYPKASTKLNDSGLSSSKREFFLLYRSEKD